MTQPNRIQVERSGAVLRLRLARPDQGNAIDLAFGHELEAAVGQVDPDVRCVAVVADGKNFCVGGNVRGFAAAEDTEAHLAEVADALHAGLTALTALEVPVVIGVQGWAAGAGMSLALVADILLLERSARLRTAYTGIGLSPDGGMTWTLPRAVGQARAMDLFLTNRPMDADEALATGLASRLVSDGAVQTDVDALAGVLAAGPVEAHRNLKRLVRQGRNRSYAEQLPDEGRTIAALSAGPEGQEGIASFLERRPPRFEQAVGHPE